MLDKPHSKFKHVYAIVRFDFPVNQDDPENSVMVVKGLLSKGVAEQQVSRLNKLNPAKQCRYELQTTRLIP
jgi:hypothetical protein